MHRNRQGKVGFLKLNMFHVSALKEYLHSCSEQEIHLRTTRVGYSTRDVPKVMSTFFLHANWEKADEGECGGRWNQLLCYP